MNQLKLNKFWWVYLPILLIVTQLAIELFASNSAKTLLLEEGGALETVQALFMACGFILSCIILTAVKNIWLRVWYLIAALGTFYVAGEEVSWGQWIFYWDTPEEWAALNDQNETNFHNMSAWFDQKPQALLQIGVLVGGIIIPFLQKYHPSRLPQKFIEIYGDYHLLPTALIALSLKIIDTLSDLFHIGFFWRISEVLELFIYYFVALYLMLVLKKQQNRTNQ